uniref:ethanolamine kinase n=1 Tax=Timema douglasi TaxID=61478 RepID=A0A7R8VT63_TIMDO|nr:unnamed protein product [Timema douglasi]
MNVQLTSGTSQVVPITIGEDKLVEGSQLVLSAIRPAWSKDKIKFKITYSQSIQVQVFTDGITNKLVGCFHSDYPDDVVLVRVYGQKTDMLIDRTSEIRNIQFLHKAGLAPRLWATFRNGLAYEYVPGDILSVDMCKDPAIFPLIATMMARIHRLDCGPDVPRVPSLWKKAKQFMAIMPIHFDNPEKQASITSNNKAEHLFPRRLENLVPCRDRLDQEYLLLQSHLSAEGSPVVFSHNDLLLANVIYNADRNTVTFIDYEYANYNYQAFDIGNHFAEFAGVTEVDYSRYPNPEFQRDWLRVYLETFNEPTVLNGPGYSSKVTNDDIDRLYVQVNKFSLASHFFWGIWGLIQAEHSAIDFDFLGYSAIRFKEYFDKKDRFLSLDITKL